MTETLREPTADEICRVANYLGLIGIDLLSLKSDNPNVHRLIKRTDHQSALSAAREEAAEAARERAARVAEAEAAIYRASKASADIKGWSGLANRAHDRAEAAARIAAAIRKGDDHG